MQRYFALNRKENQFLLEPTDYYHIKKVMRMKDGDQIEVVFHQELFLCCLENVNYEPRIIIQKQLEIKNDFMKNVVLVVPVLKESKMDLILQKATELGVLEIIPVIMNRCVVKVEQNKIEKKLERWQKIMKEASEQCMRHIIPNIQPIQTLEEIKKIEGVKMVCSTKEQKNTFKKFLQTTSNYDKLVIVIGPEGGLELREEQELIDNGFIPVTLGPRIMRVETVPIYLLSVLNYEYME